MNPGLNIALAVELGRRPILALLTPADKAELLPRNWIAPIEEVDVFAMASE